MYKPSGFQPRGDVRLCVCCGDLCLLVPFCFVPCLVVCRFLFICLLLVLGLYFIMIRFCMFGHKASKFDLLLFPVHFFLCFFSHSSHVRRHAIVIFLLLLWSVRTYTLCTDIGEDIVQDAKLKWKNKSPSPAPSRLGTKAHVAVNGEVYFSEIGFAHFVRKSSCCVPMY